LLDKKISPYSPPEIGGEISSFPSPGWGRIGLAPLNSAMPGCKTAFNWMGYENVI